MTNTARPESFHIVGEQIAATLHIAHMALENYVEGDADPQGLDKCVESLHAARGALLLLEVYGASLLAEEMELTCEFLASESQGAEHLTDEVIEALSRAMVQLPAYIERIMGGGRDIPLVLLPLLNDLRAARGKPLLSESTLLLLNIEPSGDAKDEQPVRSPSGEDIAALLGQLRPQFQLGLLGWIKDGNSKADLRRMANVAARLEEAVVSSEAHQLWWVVGGVLEALIVGGLDSNVALKRLMGQADREIKRMQTLGEAEFASSPPVDLVNNLLYYVARSKDGGERCKAIRAAFNISDVSPGDEQVEEVRESLSAPSPKLMQTVAGAIREDLAKAKDVLDIYVRTGMKDISDLAAQVGLLQKIGDTLGVLGLGQLRQVILQRSRELEDIVNSQGDPQEARLVGLAASLLEVEGRLDAELLSLLRSRSDDDEELVSDPAFNEVTQAVMRECIVNLARIKEAITQVVAHGDDQSPLDGLDEQVRGIAAGLTMLGKERAVSLLMRIGNSVRQHVQSGAASSDLDSVNRLADSIVSIEYYMETIRAGRKEPEYMLDNAERSLDVLESAVVIALPTDEPVMDSHTRTLQIDTEQLSQLPDVPPEVAPQEPAAPVVAYEKTKVLDMPVLSTGDDRPDPELLELFIEEAREEIAAIRRHFPTWAENQVDDEALITIRRSFHTLKGSGRMVGAAQLGEYSWGIESLLNKVISKTVEPNPGMVRFLEEAITVLPELLEQLEAGTEPTSDLEAIGNAAEIFAAGDMPEAYAAPSRTSAEAETESQEAEDLLAEQPDVTAEPSAEELTDMDPVLLDILTRETGSHIATVRKFVRDNERDEPPYVITEELHRACHTLHGSVIMANAVEAGVITEPLYALVERLYRSSKGLGREELQLCAAGADAIEATVASLAEADTATPDTSDLQASLHFAAERYVAESTPVGAEELDEEQDLGLTDSLPVQQIVASSDEVAADGIPEFAAPGPDFDAEIADIFAEEAAEILEAADAAMTNLAANRSNPAPMSELQRHLHTLKGGARMAGIATMGDFSHELESLLMRINQGGTGLDDSAYTLLQASFDELHRMREQVSSGVVAPPADELAARLAAVVEATMVTPVLRPQDLPEPLQPEVEEAEETSAEAAEAQSIEEDSVAEPAEESPDETSADATGMVPEPELLGELARELTTPQPPQEARPLPEELATTAAAPAPEIAPRKEMARVDSAMLEDLLNNAGEISISHSRLNQQMSSIQFNLIELGQTVHRLQQQLRLLEIETEAQILFRHQAEAKDDEEFDPLELDRYSTIQQLSRALAETASDVSSIKDLLQNTAADTETILMQQARTTSELQDNLMRTRMVPFEQHVPRLSRLIRQQAVESGKQVELVVEGSSGELDRQVMEKMLPPLEHMLRNAVIHGIELPAAREQAGKDAEAKIVIRFRRDGAQVLVDVSDDGAGLDLASIRQKAIDQKLINAEQPITDEEVTQLILQSGLTTAGKLTQSAGRGIGMDVVISEIAKLGGTLAIESITGKGCTFTVRLPYTLAITQAFIVKIGPEIFALPLPTVEGVVRLSRREFDGLLAQDNPMVDYGGRKYRLRHLGLYLGLGPATISQDEEQVAVILVEAGDNSAALIVDETADSREIVVKPIGSQLATIRGIAGATILGDGRIVVILDPGSVVRSVIPGSMEVQPAARVKDDLPPLALVVDDSITMRRVTQRLLERNGMRVITAKDGVEALEVLQDHNPDLVILDIEMPRMDGYEFAGHVRNNPDTASLPIIMVTSRTGEKHRARAIELGVNDYLGKPYQEPEMLEAIRHILGDDFNVGENVGEHDVVS